MDYRELLKLATDETTRPLIVGVAVERQSRNPVPLSVVLIVEDELFTLEAAEIVIQDMGHRTLSASDTDEAQSLLRSPHRIDVLFTDIYLKTAILGGLKIAEEATKLRPNLRVLYATGTFITENMRARFVEGAQCLRKPYSVQLLQDAITDLLPARGS